MVVFPVPPFWERTAIVGQADGRIVGTGPRGAEVRKFGKNDRRSRIASDGFATSGRTIMAHPYTNPSRARSKKARNPGG